MFGRLLKLGRISPYIIAVIAQAIKEDRWQMLRMRMGADILSLRSPQSSLSPDPIAGLLSLLIPSSPSQRHGCLVLPRSHADLMPCHGGESVPLYLSWGLTSPWEMSEASSSHLGTFSSDRLQDHLSRAG